MLSVDIVEELRLRRIAREQYVPPSERTGLHPVTLDELARIDAEGSVRLSQRSVVDWDAGASCETIHPDDDTILTDLEDESEAAPSPLFGSQIVPLMPDIPGWHGPHEIVPPHLAAAAGAETREFHYT